MWCETQKNGTVKYCERYTDPLTEKVKKVTTTMPKDTPQNRNKAMRILNGKIDAALNSVYTDKKITLKELQEAYHAAQCVTCKQSTTKRNYIIINSVLSLLDKDAIVNNLTAQYVNNQLLDSNKPISTLNTYITRFKAMFLKYMQEQNMWHWYYVTKFLVLTGLRFGELAALKDMDVNLSTLNIHIDKTYDSINMIVTTPKTDHSIRDIHIQPELQILVKQIRLWRKEVMSERKISPTLFLQISPHKLRHTHASLLAANGMTPEQIARRLGHSRSDVTKEIYIHVTKQVIENDKKAIDSIALIS